MKLKSNRKIKQFLKGISIKRALIIVAPIWIFWACFIYYSFVSPVLNPNVNFINPFQFKVNKTLFHHYLHSSYIGIKKRLTSPYLSLEEFDSFNIKIAPSDIQKLNSNLPQSGKEKFYDAVVEINKVPYKAKVKYRGFSYWHWSYPHKSWRIILEDGKMIEGLNTIDIINPKNIFSPLEPSIQELATKAGLWKLKSKLVKVSVNNNFMGHSLMTEKLNNDFLHNNSHLHGSIYGIEQEIGKNQKFDSLAWTNPSLWLDIYSTENFKSKKEVMGNFNRSLQLDSLSFYNFVKNNFNLDNFLTYIALDSILGVLHHTSVSSQRIFFDSLRGLYSPISWDHLILVHDKMLLPSRNPLFDKWRTTPQLEHLLLKKIYSLMSKELTTDTVIGTFESKYKEAIPLIKADPNLDATDFFGIINSNPTQIFPFDERKFTNISNYIISQLHDRQKYLSSYLKEINFTYQVKDNQLLVSNYSEIPIEVEVNSSHSVQKYILYPKKYIRPYQRLYRYIAPPTFFGHGSIETQKQTYKIELNKNLKYNSSTLTFRNAVTNEIIQPNLKLFKEVLPIADKKYVHKVTKVNDRTIIWKKASINIDSPLVIEKNETLIIRPGTNVYFSNGTFLQIEGNIKVLGTKSSPVTFQGIDWNGLVLINKNNHKKKSLIKNLNIFGTTSNRSSFIKKDSALSVIDQNNLLIDNISILNSKSDQSFSIYNSKNITVNNFKTDFSLSTSVDVNFSENIIFSNFEISNSFNDAFKINSSSVELTNIDIDNFFKKGLSLLNKTEVLKSQNINISNGETALLLYKTNVDQLDLNINNVTMKRHEKH